MSLTPGTEYNMLQGCGESHYEASSWNSADKCAARCPLHHLLPGSESWGRSPHITIPRVPAAHLVWVSFWKLKWPIRLSDWRANFYRNAPQQWDPVQGSSRHSSCLVSLHQADKSSHREPLWPSTIQKTVWASSFPYTSHEWQAR